jgi:hypothetical protein
MTGSKLDPPPDASLPMFVYGALKPGMPAFERIRPFTLAPYQRDQVKGALYVRDGLPLVYLDREGMTQGFLLKWNPGLETEGYRAICEFEPKKHYQWAEIALCSGMTANGLTVRYPGKGNPQPLHSAVWRLSDDPAFGEGLRVVRESVQELKREEDTWSAWQKFFRSQMAYLLLWSILERLSALCCGPGEDPNERVKRLHELPGMTELVATYVHRTDRVSDSRDPSCTIVLEASNPKSCFQYYYRVRSNLSHRGKAMFNELHKVQDSLDELCSITEHYLKILQNVELQA